jgi:hypothetical protein
MVMLHTGGGPQEVLAVLVLTWRINHAQPESAADGTLKQFHEVL